MYVIELLAGVIKEEMTMNHSEASLDIIRCRGHMGVRVAIDCVGIHGRGSRQSLAYVSEFVSFSPIPVFIHFIQFWLCTEAFS